MGPKSWPGILGRKKEGKEGVTDWRGIRTDTFFFFLKGLAGCTEELAKARTPAAGGRRERERVYKGRKMDE